MKVSEAKTIVKSLGLTLSSKKNQYGEWRLNFRGGKENTAYYTEDIQDAVDTARAMAKELVGRCREAEREWN